MQLSCSEPKKSHPKQVSIPVQSVTIHISQVNLLRAHPSVLSCKKCQNQSSKLPWKAAKAHPISISISKATISIWPTAAATFSKALSLVRWRLRTLTRANPWTLCTLIRRPTSLRSQKMSPTVGAGVWAVQDGWALNCRAVCRPVVGILVVVGSGS
uniref:Uncharacterized protein n=1 Tax=Cacopsylla melanoneura TaxID=428564 RepID=A0A8D8SRR7_9HEMI